MLRNAMIGVGLVAVTLAFVSCGHKEEARFPGGIGGSKVGFNSPKIRQQQSTISQVEPLMAQHRYPEAEAIVDQNMGKSMITGVMAGMKAELLALCGNKAESVAMYRQIDANRYGQFSASSDYYVKPFLMAVDIGSTGDTDYFASKLMSMEGRSGTLAIPKVRISPQSRIAYAYVCCYFKSIGDSPKGQGNLQFLEKADQMLPNDVVIMVNLADAYHARRGPGDDDRSMDFYNRAYRIATAAQHKEIAEIYTSHGWGPIGG